jgi:hypothetical protein
MASGEAQPVPFHLRWLMPKLCGVTILPWACAAWASALALTVGVFFLARAHGLENPQAFLAAGLVLGMPAVRFMLVAPVLMDLHGTAFAVLAAVAAVNGELELAVAISVLGSCVSEKVSVFAALFALEPLLLAGALAPVIRFLTSEPGEVDPDEPNAETLMHPFKSALRAHYGRWREPDRMIFPWGVGLLALMNPTPQLLAVLAVAYAQLLIATDVVRLYQSASPIVCIIAASVVPVEWIPVALVAHWFNPWAWSAA